MRISDWSSDVCSSDRAGQVLDAAAANHDDRMFLQVMAFAGNVGGDFETVGEADARDLAQGRIGLFRGDREGGVGGKRVLVSVDIGGGRVIKKKKKEHRTRHAETDV